MRETVNIEMTTTTSVEHHSHGKLSSSYTTTIPLDVSFKDARLIIKQVAEEIATRINEDFRLEKQQENTSTYILTSVTQDLNANHYCFAAEYGESVLDFVMRYAKGDIEVDV